MVRAARLLGDAAMEARLMGPRRAALTAFPCALMENPAQARDKAQSWLDDMDVAMGRMVEMRAAVVGYLKAGQ